MVAIRRRLPPIPTRFEARELAIRLVLLPFGFTPRGPRAWAAAAVTWLLMRRSGYRTYAVGRVPPGLCDAAGKTRERFAVESERRMRVESALLWRDVLVPRWKRPVRLLGLEHVHMGLARGRGVILWVQPCISTNVAVKQALHDAGFPLAHLSRPSHPFSGAPFGRRFVNPVLRRPEMRVLAERVVIDDEHTVAALRRLRALLADNRVVSISAAGRASSRGDVPFLGGILRLPSGPPQLAAATGAALLPVFTSGPPEAPVVEIGAALPAASSASGLEACHLAAAGWLESRVRADPLAWPGWRQGLLRRRDAPPATQP